MNREIKFKAFVEPHSVDKISGIVDVKSIHFGTKRIIVSCEWGNLSIDNFRYKLMQYTCLKDKHGVEIYEGDIVKVTEDYDTYGMASGEIYKVAFLKGGFRCAPKYGKGYGYYLEKSEDFEVIGNEFENPELLKVGVR